MSDREWAHILLMRLKSTKGARQREDAVLGAFSQIRASEQRRTYHALQQAVAALTREEPTVEPGFSEGIE